MESFTTDILLTIQNYNEWAWLVVFVIAFAESLAIIGVMVPGWFLLVGVGTLIGADVLSFYPIVMAAYVGAVLGEYLSYLLGYHFHQKILAWSLFKSHQALLDKARMFFERYGTSGVFFGRFIGPLRAIIPFSAGVFQMKKSTFTWVNLTSGLIWAPLYLAPGIFAGAAYKLDKELGMESAFVILLICFIGWYMVKQGRQLLLLKKTNIENRRIDFTQKSRLINFVLALSIFLIANIIFLKSHYYDFLKTLFSVLFI